MGIYEFFNAKMMQPILDEVFHKNGEQLNPKLENWIECFAIIIISTLASIIFGSVFNYVEFTKISQNATFIDNGLESSDLFSILENGQKLWLCLGIGFIFY